MRNGGRRMGCAATLIIVSALSLPTRTWSSQLTILSVGPSDSMLGKRRRVTAQSDHRPLSQPSAAYTASKLFYIWRACYSKPQGHDNTIRELLLVPNFADSTDRWAPFSVAFGAYGSLGFAYNFDPDPSRGAPNKFFTKLVVI